MRFRGIYCCTKRFWKRKVQLEEESVFPLCLVNLGTDKWEHLRTAK